MFAPGQSDALMYLPELVDLLVEYFPAQEAELGLLVGRFSLLLKVWKAAHFGSCRGKYLWVAGAWRSLMERHHCP